jgi:hypothetical protein
VTLTGIAANVPTFYQGDKRSLAIPALRWLIGSLGLEMARMGERKH